MAHEIDPLPRVVIPWHQRNVGELLTALREIRDAKDATADELREMARKAAEPRTFCPGRLNFGE